MGGANQISIALANRGAPHPAVSFPGGFRTPADRPMSCCMLSQRAGLRNPSQFRTRLALVTMYLFITPVRETGCQSKGYSGAAGSSAEISRRETLQCRTAKMQEW